MESNREILVLGEITEGGMATTTKELLTVGRKLINELYHPLSILLIGKKLQEVANEAFSFGAERVYLVDNPFFSFFHPDYYTEIIVQLCRKILPSIILFSHTDVGRDVAPRLAARMEIPVTLDCIELDIDPITNKILQTKPIYGGNARAIWVNKSNHTQIITIRPKSIAVEKPDMSIKGEIIPFNPMIDDSITKVELLETIKEEVKSIGLEEARVIVAGGGGIGGREGFKLLEELARILGGTIGGSRVACDEGWISHKFEIGQTGHIVSPDLYIAVGISGAIQHLAGCINSKIIVAINRDPDAYIFKEADFGVVGDYREVLPPFIEECKRLLRNI